MPRFEIERPDGVYEVEAPDMERALAAFPPVKVAPPPDADPIRAQVRQELTADAGRGVPTQAGYGRQVLQGATLGFADEALAGASVPLEMMKRGTINPVEAYNFAKAREDLRLEDARKNNGALGTAAEIGGGVLGAGPAAVGAAANVIRQAPTALRAIGRGMGIGGALGGAAGVGEGSGLEGRIQGGAQGAGLGLAVGGAIPGAAAVAGPAFRGATAYVRALSNPESFAQNQIARAVVESGRSVDDITRSLTQAADEGQGVYNVADALGNAGGRMLSTVARNPGAGRTQVVEALEGRQAEQSRRVINALTEGFGSPQTAERTIKALTSARDETADLAYGAARREAGAVDVTPALMRADQTINPGVSGIMQPASNIADDTIESAVRKARSLIGDASGSQVTDFSVALRAKHDIDDMITAAERAGQNNKARLLGQVRNELDESLTQASAPYAKARDEFAAGSRRIEAVDLGKEAASGARRTEDIIPEFRALEAGAKPGYRAGYVDPLIAKVQNVSGDGTNRARPFTSQGFREESAAIAPMQYGPQMTRRLDREMEMFATRNQASGGSRTADNLADNAAFGNNVEIVADLLTGGGVFSAGRKLLSRGADTISGNTPEVREKVAQTLLATARDIPRLQPMIQQAVDGNQRALRTIQELLRGVQGGSAIALNRQPERRDRIQAPRRVPTTAR